MIWYTLAENLGCNIKHTTKSEMRQIWIREQEGEVLGMDGLATKFTLLQIQTKGKVNQMLHQPD